jgi:DNA topoisomerase IA
MGKSILMVAEKPAIAQAIANALAGNQARLLRLIC